MNRFLSVSKAARIAGVSRSVIQKEIRAGTLPTFEGKVSVSDLKSAYPDIQLEDEAVLERMSRLQHNALFKLPKAQQGKPRDLAEEVHRLQVQLADARAEIARHRKLVYSLKQRLTALQGADDCTRQQKLVLQALIRWMLANLERRA
jgi:CDP-4-dehydro-6-deoxyglucose reductase